MSTIRRQSIISSGIVYFGFALGAVTNLFLAKEFNPDQYGLMNGMFLAIGTIIFSFSNMGMTAYIGKFYPYYNDNLSVKENDLMTRALLTGLTGFGVALAAGVLLKGTVIRYYQDQSSELGHYYYWIFLFGFGMTFFSLLEAFAWQVKRSVLTNYLREVQFRLTTIVLIGLYLAGVIHGFDTFIKLYAFNYVLVALILGFVLFRSGKLRLVFSRSRVTRRFSSRIRSLVLLAWSGGLTFNVAFFFAQVIIAGVVAGGLTAVGIFTFAQFIGSIVQAPQRGITAAAIGPLSQAWKDKDYGRIGRIYQRSSISQLIFSTGMFLLIWINFRDGILTFHLNHGYLDSRPVFFFIGLARITDMGTGVNTQVIGTSSYWRFDFFSGLILVALTLPLNYWLAKELGVTGPAIADLITFAIYNGIRWAFLYRKFNMQPFNRKTVYTLLLGAGVYVICDRLFGKFEGFLWIVARSGTFVALYVAGVLALRLSEDILPVWQSVKKRMGLGR